jgi:acetaldehyde dehydrogenase (acetylating)
MGTLGAVGLTTGLMPSMTLGAGGEGGSITGDNVSVHHLYNIKRLAYEKSPPPTAVMQRPGSLPTAAPAAQPDVESLVKQVVQEIINQTRSK